MIDKRVVFITGGAKRLGAQIVRKLHANGMNIILHFRNSTKEAQQLKQELTSKRQDSISLIQGDLLNTLELDKLVSKAAKIWGRLDVLINNASTFYPTPVGKVSLDDWDNLLGVNLKAPLFLSQAASSYLQKTQGTIINIADIHGERPLKEHTVYSIAKAGLIMLTKSLARELGPDIRVNAIAPGAILWPEHALTENKKQHIILDTALKRAGQPEDIANAVWYLMQNAAYTTGQVLVVDGGRTLSN